MGRLDAGQESLFGKEKCDYSSSNVMSATTGRKVQVKSYVPVRSQKTADQRKNEEFHGKTINTNGKKNDGSLMADCADWRNP